MNSSRIVYWAVAVAGLGLFAAIAASSCALEPGADAVDAPHESAAVAPDPGPASAVDDPELRSAVCPRGWVDPERIHLNCARGFLLDVDYFYGSLACAHCVRGGTGRECRSPWVGEGADLNCARGEQIVAQGPCKRCASVEETGGCRADADCIRTGCMGQLCSGEPEVTTCEWREQYACYSGRFSACVCAGGRCGWAKNELLTACLRDAGGR